MYKGKDLTWHIEGRLGLRKTMVGTEAEKDEYEKGWDDAMKRLTWEFFDSCKRYDLNHFALHIFGRAKGKDGFSMDDPDSAADVVRIVEKACLMTLAKRNDNSNNET